MESLSNFCNSTYRYGDGIFFELVHDFQGHAYDAWLYKKEDQTRKMYLMSMSDRIPQSTLMKKVREKIDQTI